MRRTKHARRGEEDVGYSYVVVRRGERIRDPSNDAVNVGRVGAVGRWAEEAERDREERKNEGQAGKVRWTIDEDGIEAGVVIEESDAVRVEASEDTIPVDGLQDEVVTNSSVNNAGTELKGELEDALRNEAYGWPRINFPPLKRSGHVLIDACMPEGTCFALISPSTQQAILLFPRYYADHDFL